MTDERDPFGPIDRDPFEDPIPPDPEPTPPPRAFDPFAPHAQAGTGVICVGCGYNLTGATIGGRCPECGTPTELSVVRGQRPTSGMAITSLVLGILSLTICLCPCASVPLGGLAVIFGIQALLDAKAGLCSANSKGMAIAGIVMGTIGALIGLAMFGLGFLA